VNALLALKGKKRRSRGHDHGKENSR